MWAQPFRLLIALSACAAIAVSPQRSTTPIQLVKATKIGATAFEPGDRGPGGNRPPVDGIE